MTLRTAGTRPPPWHAATIGWLCALASAVACDGGLPAPSVETVELAGARFVASAPAAVPAGDEALVSLRWEPHEGVHLGALEDLDVTLAFGREACVEAGPTRSWEDAAGQQLALRMRGPARNAGSRGCSVAGTATASVCRDGCTPTTARFSLWVGSLPQAELPR